MSITSWKCFIKPFLKSLLCIICFLLKCSLLKLENKFNRSVLAMRYRDMHLSDSFLPNQTFDPLSLLYSAPSVWSSVHRPSQSKKQSYRFESKQDVKTKRFCLLFADKVPYT